MSTDFKSIVEQIGAMRSDHTTARADLISQAHSRLNALLERPSMFTESPEKAKEMVEAYEYSLQFLFGFNPDRTKHRYWHRLKGCTCPKMDNDERFGVEQKIFSGDCPYHGLVDIEKDKWRDFGS